MAYKYRLIIFCLIAILLSCIAIFTVFWMIPPGSNYFEIVTMPGTAILSSILASSIVVIVIDVIVRKGGEEEISKLFEKSASRAILRLLKLGDSGVQAVYDRFYNEEFIRETTSENDIVILQTYAPNMSTIQMAIHQALDGGRRVRVALIHNESKFADIRWVDTDDSREGFIGGVNKCVSVLEGIKSENVNGKHLEIKLYDGAPGVCIYGVEGKSIMVGAFLSGRDSVSSPFVKLSYESTGYKSFIAHFNKIWEGATSINDNSDEV